MSTDATGQDGDRAIDRALALPDLKDMTIVARGHFNPSDVTVLAQLERIKAAEPQAMISWTTGAAMGTLMKGMAQIALDGKVPLLRLLRMVVRIKGTHLEAGTRLDGRRGNRTRAEESLPELARIDKTGRYCVGTALTLQRTGTHREGKLRRNLVAAVIDPVFERRGPGSVITYVLLVLDQRNGPVVDAVTAANYRLAVELVGKAKPRRPVGFVHVPQRIAHSGSGSPFNR